MVEWIQLSTAISSENLSLEVCDQVRLNPSCSTREPIKSLENLGIATNQVDNKDTDQTVWMCRLAIIER